MTVQSGIAEAELQCPRCKSSSVWKDGKRRYNEVERQRYLCRECGYRFTGTGLKGPFTEFDRQVCDTDRGSKNLIVANEKATGDILKNNEFFNYAWYLKKEGKSESTIETYVKLLTILSKRGADLDDPESVKGKIAVQKWVNKRKGNAVNTYTHYLALHGKTWNPPIYKELDKPIFLPKESEIDSLISGSGLKTSVLIQCLKETGARIGEIISLQWKDIDFESNIIRITPEKRSKARIIKVSTRLMQRLANVKNVNQVKDPNRIFSSYNSVHKLFHYQRSNIARKLSNDRLLQIKFHTLRHWHATKLYHETRDIYFVQRRLGHRSITNTMKYIHLAGTYFGEEDDEYITQVAETIEQAVPLIEAGYVEASDYNGVKIFKIRKSSLGRVR